MQLTSNTWRIFPESCWFQPAYQMGDSKFRIKLQNLGVHYLAGLEFHRGAGGDWHIYFGAVRVAPDMRLANSYLEYPEVAEFHLVALGQRLNDVIQGFLHDLRHLASTQPGFIFDARDEIAFGQAHIGFGGGL